MKKELLSWSLVTAFLAGAGLLVWGEVAAWPAFWAALARLGLGVLGVVYFGLSILALVDVWVDSLLERQRRQPPSEKPTI